MHINPQVHFLPTGQKDSIFCGELDIPIDVIDIYEIIQMLSSDHKKINTKYLLSAKEGF